MKILNKIDLLAEKPSLKNGRCLAIGNFDGLHRGHQELISLLQKEAKNSGLISSILTFDPHPAEFFSGKPSATLFANDVKQKALEETGIDEAVIQFFDKGFASLSAEEFVKKILVDALSVKKVLVGEEFKFGKDRSGDFNYLSALLKGFGAQAEAVKPVLDSTGQKIGSRRIREMIERGEIAEANQLLGHSYLLYGEVVRRAGNGARIGFPTINLKLSDCQQLLLDGVYAGKVCLPAEQDFEILKTEAGKPSEYYPTVFNIGFRPTVDGQNKERTIEGHIYSGFAPEKNITGQKVAFYFERRLRGEMKFDSLDSLKEQIRKDILNAKS